MKSSPHDANLEVIRNLSTIITTTIISTTRHYRTAPCIWTTWIIFNKRICMVSHAFYSSFMENVYYNLIYLHLDKAFEHFSKCCIPQYVHKVLEIWNPLLTNIHDTWFVFEWVLQTYRWYKQKPRNICIQR